LRHWLADPDLAGVRGPDALAGLPAAEQQEWGRLWAEVAGHAALPPRDALAAAQRGLPAAPRPEAPIAPRSKLGHEPDGAGPAAREQAARPPTAALNPHAGGKGDEARVPSPVALLRSSVVNNRVFVAAALRPPHVYVLDRVGDLWVFRLPAEAEEKPVQGLLEIGHVLDAGDGQALAVVGDTLFCTRIGSLEAFSLTDPARPRPLGRFESKSRENTRVLVRDQERLILIGQKTLSIFDVSRPTSPVFQGTTTVHTGTSRQIFNTGCVAGGRLYVAEGHLPGPINSRQGITVYDMADPKALKEMGFVETPALPSYLLPAGKDRLAVLMRDMRDWSRSAQLFSLADPLKPVPLGRPVATAGSGTLFPIDGETYLVTASDVFRLEDDALIPVGGYRSGSSTYGVSPYQGDCEEGDAVITVDNGVVAWRPKAASAARLILPRGPRVQPGQELDMAGPTLEGKKFDLKQLRGKVVLIDFWASWCGPCQVEMPNVKAVYERHHPDGLEIVGISLDNSREATTRYLKSNGVPWPQLFFEGKGEQGWSEQGWNNPLVLRYGVDAIPFTILLDRAGKVVQVGVRGAALEPAVARLLGKEPAPPK
jgi:thiol-disulfide isomerase/thioredoxin